MCVAVLSDASLISCSGCFRCSLLLASYVGLQGATTKVHIMEKEHQVIYIN